MVAYRALKEKYRLCSFRMPLEAQSGLHNFGTLSRSKGNKSEHIVPRGGGRDEDLWTTAPQLCSCPFGGKLTPSLPYSYRPRQPLLWRAVCGDMVPLFVILWLLSQITPRMCHLSVRRGKGQCARMEESQGGFPRSWMAYKHSAPALARAQLAFQYMLWCKGGQMRIMRCDWGWEAGWWVGGGEEGRGTGQFNSGCDSGGGGRCMAPSQQSTGKQWSRLMIHSLIVMAPTERMGTRRSSWKSIPRKHMSTSCKSWPYGRMDGRRWGMRGEGGCWRGEWGDGGSF